MSVLVLLIFASLAIATGFLAAFIWAVRSGQYEDTCTPSMRVLMEDGRAGATPARVAGNVRDTELAVRPASSAGPRNLGADQVKDGVVAEPGSPLNSAA